MHLDSRIWTGPIISPDDVHANHNANSQNLGTVGTVLRYFFTGIAERGAKGEGLYFNTDRDAYTEKKSNKRVLEISVKFS